MKKNVKFVKDQGYVYDLFFLFIFYFNREFVIKDYINYNKSREDTEYFREFLSDFLPIPGELLPFFYLKDNGVSFMRKFYFDYYANIYADIFTDDYNLSLVQNALSDYDSVILNMLNYYFDDITEKEIEDYNLSKASINSVIKRSRYSGDVRSRLYEFFLDPVPMIQKLSYELMAKDFLLKQKYEKNFENIVKFQTEFDFESVALKLKECRTYKLDVDNFTDIYISVCSIAKNTIILYPYENNKIFILLGIDSDSYLEYLKVKNILPDLDLFCTALSEKNRVKILELIFQKEEITIKDLEQTFGFTGTNSYYHLSLMIKADIVKSRNQGRTVYYSINKGCFNVVCGMLSKYADHMKGTLSNESMEKSDGSKYGAEPLNRLY